MMPPGIAKRPGEALGVLARSATARRCCHIAVRTCSGGTSSVRCTSGRWWMRGMRSRLIVIATGPDHSSRNMLEERGQRVLVVRRDDRVVDVDERGQRVEQHQLADERAHGDLLHRRAAAATSRLQSITSSRWFQCAAASWSSSLLAEPALALDREHAPRWSAARAVARSTVDRRERAADRARRAARRARRARDRARARCRRAGTRAASPRGSGGTSASRSRHRRRQLEQPIAQRAASSATDRAPSASASAACRRRAARAAGRRGRGSSRRVRGSDSACTRFGSISGSSANISVDHWRGVSSKMRIRSTSGERSRASIVARIRASTCSCAASHCSSTCAAPPSSPAGCRTARGREQRAHVLGTDRRRRRPSRRGLSAPAEPDLVLEPQPRAAQLVANVGRRRRCTARQPSAELDLKAQAVGIADDDVVTVAKLLPRDAAPHHVVDVRAVRRALIDRDEPALVDADPHVLAATRDGR